MPEPTLPVNVAALAALSPAHVHSPAKEGDAPAFAATMAEVSSRLGARREAPGAGKKTPTAGASEGGTTEPGSDGEGRLDQFNASAPDAPASAAAAMQGVAPDRAATAFLASLPGMPGSVAGTGTDAVAANASASFPISAPNAPASSIDAAQGPAPASAAAAFLASQPHAPVSAVEATQVAAAAGALPTASGSQLLDNTGPPQPALEIAPGQPAPGGIVPTGGPLASGLSDLAMRADGSGRTPSTIAQGDQPVDANPPASAWHVATGARSAARSRAAAGSENASVAFAERPGGALASTGRDDQEPQMAATAGLSRDGFLEALQPRSERASPTASTAPSDAAFSIPQAAAGVVASATAGSATAQLTVQTPPSAPGFGEDFAHRVAWLIRDKVHTAEIALTPPDLGPVSVTVEMRGTEATLVFRAAHAVTRSAIEDALPRLREMLDAQGLQLADARVGTQAGQQGSRDGWREPRLAVKPMQGPPGDRDPTPITATAVLRPHRLIDVIA